jgi:ComF family protein
LQQVLKNIRAELLNLFYPNVCVACQHSLHRNEYILCTQCYAELPYTGAYKKDNAAEKLFWGRFPFEMAYSMLYFNKGNITAKLLHQFKYDGEITIGEMLGAQLALQLKNELQLRLSTVIVPIPLHSRKQSSRGFNQSDVIAQSAGKELGIEVNTTAVRRQKFTLSQTRKSRTDRLQNISDAFIVDKPDALQNKHVVLLDDICTSGATIEACALAIKTACTCDVSVVSAAIAIA